MTINEYQQLAQRTASTGVPSSKIENGILGLCGETGEIADVYKNICIRGTNLIVSTWPRNSEMYAGTPQNLLLDLA